MASSSPPLPKEAEVSRSLEKLKREPIDTEGTQDSILGPIYSLLMNAPSDVHGVLHWYCDKAKPVVVEAATFLLRLYAYTDNPRVEVWKKQFADVLHGCCGCVQGYTEAKTSSRETYFAAFSRPILDNFFSTLDSWEITIVLDAIKDAGVYDGSKKTLSDVSTAVLYHMLVAVSFFESPDILRIFQSYPPTFISSGWPIEVPPGLLLLLFHENDNTRIWAQQQIIGCSPINTDKFNGGYEMVLQAVAVALTSGTPKAPSQSSHSNMHRPSDLPLQKFFIMSPSSLWSGLQTFIRILPSTLLINETRTARIFFHAVVGHLHDKGSHFSDVLRAFIYLLKKHGRLLWQGEDHDYPQVVFDSIKDNVAFLRLIQETTPSTSQQPWFVEWFQVYLDSLDDMPIFGEVLKKIVGFTCEELQHARFQDNRPVIMSSILSTLRSIFQSTKVDDKNNINSSVAQVLEIHADVIVDVALSSKRKTQPWSTARAAARQLLSLVLGADASRAETIIFQLSDVLQQSGTSSEPKRKYDLRVPVFHKQIWGTMYGTVTGEDSGGIALLISLVARSAYLDALSPDVFNPNSLRSDTRKLSSAIVATVNAGLSAMRAGFVDAITQYTNATSNTAQVVKSLVHGPDMAKHIIALILSPVEELQLAAQMLLGQAYDVDVRSECFRALLQDLPAPSMDGLIASVNTFNDCAPLFPEACSFAKSLVRCMTDVIEVLTNGHDGLLFDEKFGDASQSVRPHARLPKLWHLMSAAITTIFRRTPLWSKFYDPDSMIDWMRDALIFTRELLAQRRTWEAAAMTVSEQSNLTLASPRKPSQIGRHMLNDLQPVLTESIRWLRLTDMELLHQSSNLVLSLMDCFRETEVKPSPDTLIKLEKFLDSSRRKTTPEDQRTKLSETHLSELMAALSSFSQDVDDDIQITGEYKPSNSLGFASLRDGKSGLIRPRDSQGRLDNFIVSPKPSGRTAASARPSVASSSKSKAFEIQHKRGGTTVPQSNSLMSQVRSQAAAHGMINAKNRSLGKPNLHTQSFQKKRERPSRPNAKDETGFTRSAVSETSSSSSEESDEEDSLGGLASLGKLQKSPLIKKRAERRTVKLMEPKFTTQNAALERVRKREEARRAAMRMKPDLRPLYRTILSWNYDHDGPEPPVVGDRPSYTPILNEFKSDQEYQQIFEPLLTLECWNQLIKSKEETVPETLLCKINSRQYIDEWLDIDVSVTDRPSEQWRLAETDIVLLRKLGGGNSVLAKVQSSQKMAVEIQATLRCQTNTDVSYPGLHISTQWHLTKVFSLSTITREFAALKALPYYDFYSDIMRPRPARVSHLPTAQVQQAMQSHQVNEPQAIAILGSLQAEGFSLIQGPPGTGKTWTICGLAGAFLSSRSRPATVVHAGRTVAPSEKITPLKILVCAPSNAAIDEVAKRLKNGVLTSDGHLVVPNIVRVGAQEAINISVKDVSLDQLVEKRLDADPKQNNTFSAVTSLASLRAEMDVLRNTRSLKMQEMTNLRHNVSQYQALEVELKSLNNKRISLSQQFNRLKDQQKSNSRTLDAARRKYRAEVLMEADIICATLSGAGHEILENLDFEMIVIDEAAQSIELSSLIPLKYRSKRCIMVGDPQQLPPTVLSPLASKFGYGQSLFVRLQKSRPEAVHLLSIQYRMHPDISRLPSKLFYAQRLQDGPGMAEKTSQLWHNHPLFGTYKFINVANGGEKQAHSGHSLVNHTECEVAVSLYNRIKTEYANIDLDFRIGIITMYRAQLLELKKKFRAVFGADVLGKVDFNTVDGFQGQEKDIIILSCVRAGPGVQSIGFLADQRRLNVAITRARASLFILGHAATLERSDQMWKEIVLDARGNSRLIDADSSTYRRPINISVTPRTTVKSIPTREHPASIPDNLKTPKNMVQTKSHLPSSLVAGPSSSISEISNAEFVPEHEESTLPHRNIAIASIPAKRRQVDAAVDDRRVAPALRGKEDNQEDHLTQPRPPPVKRRPKEVSLFIPKKKPDLKRAAPDTGNPSQGDAKRRLTDRYFD